MDTTETRVDLPGFNPLPTPGLNPPDCSTPVPDSGQAELRIIGIPDNFPRVGQQRFPENPELDKPSINMADMAALVFSLTEKMAKNNVETGKMTVDAQKQENRRLHEKRMKKIEQQIKHLLEAESKSQGFFGSLVSGLKKMVFHLDFKGFGKDMEKGFKASPFTGSVFTTMLVFTSMAVGPANGILMSAFAFTPEIVMDPGVQKEFQNFAQDQLGMSEKNAQKFAFGMGIGLCVLQAVVLGALTFGAGSSVGAARLVWAGYSVLSAGITTEGGVHSYQANKNSSEAMTDSADADTIQADQELLSTLTEKEMSLIRQLMEHIAAQMELTATIIQTQMETAMAAAKAIGHRNI